MVCSLWDMRTQQIVRTVETPEVVTSIEVQPDSSFVVTADGSEAKFWDGASLSLRKAFAQPYLVESATFCPEKSRFVVGGEDMWVHLHDYATGDEVECNKGDATSRHRWRSAQRAWSACKLKLDTWRLPRSGAGRSS